MEVIVISESNDDSLHPVTAQLVGASSSLGGKITILCPGGEGGVGDSCGEALDTGVVLAGEGTASVIKVDLMV